MTGEFPITGARKAIFVSVTNALAGRVADIPPNSPLSDTSRGFWHVNDDKIDQCELLVAVDQGFIRGIWEIDMEFMWHQMSLTAIPTRLTQNMVVDPSRKYCRVKAAVLGELKGKKLSSIHRGFRMYGPVRYNF